MYAGHEGGAYAKNSYGNMYVLRLKTYWKAFQNMVCGYLVFIN